MTDAATRRGDASAFSEQFHAAEEAALLVAGNRLAAAESLLRAARGARGGADDAERLSLMLLEVLHVAGRGEQYEAELARHVRDFPGSRPDWRPAALAGLAGALSLHGVIGARPGDLDALLAFARLRKTLVVDVGGVERIEFVFLHELQAALRMLGSQGKRVIVANASEVTATLLNILGLDRNLAVLRRRSARPALAKAA
jgi:anti-anti-sigma regulatory factor